MIRVETIQIRPTMVLQYDTYLDRPSGGSRFLPGMSAGLGSAAPPGFDRLANLSAPAYSGQLCPHAKKRLSKALNLLVAIALPKQVFNPKTGKPFTFRVNFVTLTLPAAQRSVTDRELKTKVFDPWVKSMRRKHGLRSYVWRAERQFNGNLHFHVTTDTFLPLSSIRDEWNRFLSRFHFIDEFSAQHGHHCPNSTDVHSVHKIDNIAAYMVKYMTKPADQHLSEVNVKRASKGLPPIVPDLHPFRQISGQPLWTDPVAGKVWDCSLNLKAPGRCEMASDYSTRSEVKAIVRSPSISWFNTDHAFLMTLNGGRMEAVLPPRLRRLYQDYLGYVRNYRREPRRGVPIANDRPPVPGPGHAVPAGHSGHTPDVMKRRRFLSVKEKRKLMRSQLSIDYKLYSQ